MSTEEDLPKVNITDHIQVIVTPEPDSDGRVWLYTKGMDKFGLPDLEVRDVSPLFVREGMGILNHWAQGMVDHAEPPPASLELPGPLPLEHIFEPSQDEFWGGREMLTLTGKLHINCVCCQKENN